MAGFRSDGRAADYTLKLWRCTDGWFWEAKGPTSACGGDATTAADAAGMFAEDVEAEEAELAPRRARAAARERMR